MRQWADFYRSLGLAAIIIEPGSKNPSRKAWQKEKGTAEEFEQNYKPNCNLGISLGASSGGLIDIDLDHPVALKWAPVFLPDTAWQAGRPTNPRSHWFYKAKDGANNPGTKRLRDPDRKLDGSIGVMVVEQRWTGCQTVVAPSIHPSGETYAWSTNTWCQSPVTEVDPFELHTAVKRLYAAVLFDKVWVDGQKHLASLPFVKAMLDRKVNRDTLTVFMQTLNANGSTDWNYQVQHTLDRIAGGEACQGARTLIKEYGLSMARINKIAWALGGVVDNDELEKVDHTITGILKALGEWNSIRANPIRPTTYYTWFQPGEVMIFSGPSNSFKTQWALWHATHFAEGARPHREAELLAEAFLTPSMREQGYRFNIPHKDYSFAAYISPDARAQDLSINLDRLFNGRGEDHVGTFNPRNLGTQPKFSVIARDARDVDRFEPFKLGHEQAWQNNVQLINELKARACPEHSDKAVGLVVYDTLARMVGVEDELNNASLTKMVETAEKIATATNCCVMIVHHISQAQHSKPFKEMDPRIYGRGGTATAAAARIAMGVSVVADTDGRILGAKIAANNLPPRDALYWEICPEGQQGCHYFRPVTAQHVLELQEAAKEEQKEQERQKREEARPGVDEFLRALEADGKKIFTKDDAYELVASLWLTSKGEPYSSNTSKVKTQAKKIIEELLEQSAIVKDTMQGDNGRPKEVYCVSEGDQKDLKNQGA